MAKPPPVPMPRHRRRRNDDDERALRCADSRLRKSAVIAFAVSPFLSRASGSSNTGNSAAALLAWVRVAPEKPAKAGDADDAGRIQRDLLDLAHDFGGARQRRRARQLHGDDDVAAILRRNEALRRGGKQPSGAADQHDIDQQHHHRMPDHEIGGVGIAVRQPVEAAVEERR